MSLQENAMLVSVQINNYEARKNCKEAEGVLENMFHVKDKGIKAHKHLFPGCEQLKVLNSICRRARGIVYKYTLPWEDDKTRLLPTAYYMEFIKEMQSIIMEKDDALMKLKSGYNDYINEARGSLNGLFNIEDYPSISQLDNKFEIRTTFLPVPSSGHFIVNIQETDREALKEIMNRQIEDRLSSAYADNYKRIYKVVQHMAETLKDKDAIFRDSLVDNVREMIHIARKFNVTKDKEIEETLKKVEELTKERPDTLRDDERTREKVANDAGDLANEILKKMGLA